MAATEASLCKNELNLRNAVFIPWAGRDPSLSVFEQLPAAVHAV